MLYVEQIRKLLSDRNLAEVSRRTGVGYMALARIVSGKNNPCYVNLVKLSNYLENK